MKRTVSFIFTIFALCTANALYGQTMVQRVAVVDMEYILSRLPQYADAQQQLDKLQQMFQGEIDKAKVDVGRLEKNLEEEKILLTPQMIAEREDEIKYRRNLANELAMKYFGTEGEFLQQRRLLVRPVQDLVHTAVKEIAERNKLDVVLDKSNDAVLYFNNNSDISEQIVTRLRTARQ